MSCGICHRCSSDLALLWLWHRPEAVAPIGPLAWEPPHAAGAALKTKKKKKKEEPEVLRVPGVLGWAVVSQGPPPPLWLPPPHPGVTSSKNHQSLHEDTFLPSLITHTVTSPCSLDPRKGLKEPSQDSDGNHLRLDSQSTPERSHV